MRYGHFSQILFFCLCILVVVSMISYDTSYKLVEQFFGNAHTITLLRDRERLNIVSSSSQPIYDESLLQFVQSSQNKYQMIMTDTPNKNDIVCAAVISELPKDALSIAVTDDHHMCCLLRHTQSLELQTMADVLRNNALLYYIYDHDITLLEAIVTALGNTENIADLKKNWIKVADIKTAKSFVFRATPENNVFFWSGNPKDPIVSRELSKQACSIVPFEEAKADILRFMLPHVVVGNYDWKKMFTKIIDRFPVKQTLIYRNVLYMLDPTPQTYLLEYIVRFFEKNKEFLTYYEISSHKLTIHPLAKRILWSSVNDATKETFVDGPIVFQPDRKVRVYLDGETDTLYLTNPEQISQDVSLLRKGDRIVLALQTRKIENGTWELEDLRKGQFQPFWACRRVSNDLSTWRTFATEDEDPRYLCYEQPRLAIKGLCKSDVDLNGNRKNKGVWDRPCDHDKECPFFQKNTRYMNYRGGCMSSGYCEMPLGVKRTGFRTYEGNAFCHGCGSGKSGNFKCCDEQETPDYAFAFDEYERLPKTTLVESFAPLQDDREYLNGDFSTSVMKGQYHDEITNKEMESMLETLHEKSVVMDANVNLLDLIIKFLNQTEEQQKDDNQLVQFSPYDVRIAHKDIALEDTFTVLYVIDATLYRTEKSHGKRVRLTMKHDIKTNAFTMEQTKVLGFVPQYDISDKNDISVKRRDVARDAKPFTGIRCANESLDSIIHPYETTNEYICETVGKKLSIDRNLVMPGCK